MASPRERIWILRLPVRSWFLKEILSSAALWIFLFIKYDLSKFSVVNIHIAYPLLTYFHCFRRKIGVPVIISEHWSAYHFNFGVRKELKRIKRIFSFGLPLITVSGSLAEDIEKFSGQPHRTHILPNVVDQTVFRMSDAGPATTEPRRFFMLGCWQYPKMPWIILEALNCLRLEGFHFILRIGGYGPYEQELREKIVSLGMEKCAFFIGKLNFREAAVEMQNATFFLHASQYETFSLVCAEALSCGTPVIASAVGGIPEYLHPANGILVSKNDVRSWSDALRGSFGLNLNRRHIGKEAAEKFSPRQIGEAYKAIMHRVKQTECKA
jgi:glycosyltransferase involved in cell wall biosynthesis